MPHVPAGATGWAGVSAEVAIPCGVERPDLHDMLAALLLSRRIAGLPGLPGLLAFLRHAEALRGRRPAASRLPPEISLEGVFLALRHAQPEPLVPEGAAASAFFAGWSRLERAILRAAGRKLDPATDLFLDRPLFASERLFLARDREAYRDDLERGERWLLEAAGPGPATATLLVEPRCRLPEFWLRCDPEAFIEGPHRLLIVHREPGEWSLRFDADCAGAMADLRASLGRAEEAGRSQRGAAGGWRLSPASGQLSSPPGGSSLSRQKVRECLRSALLAIDLAEIQRRHFQRFEQDWPSLFPKFAEPTLSGRLSGPFVVRSRDAKDRVLSLRVHGLLESSQTVRERFRDERGKLQAIERLLKDSASPARSKLFSFRRVRGLQCLGRKLFVEIAPVYPLITLRRWRRKRERIARTDLLGLVRRISLALGFLHAHGLVHRDLSPDNVLVLRHRKSYRAVVAGFGAVHDDRSVSRVPDLFFAPPDLREDDPKRDTYSLALVTAWLIRGTLDEPFRTGPHGTVSPELFATAKSERSVLGVDEAWYDLVLRLVQRATSRKPEQRPLPIEFSRALAGLPRTGGNPEQEASGTIGDPIPATAEEDEDFSELESGEFDSEFLKAGLLRVVPGTEAPGSEVGCAEALPEKPVREEQSDASLDLPPLDSPPVDPDDRGTARQQRGDILRRVLGGGSGPRPTMPTSREGEASGGGSSLRKSRLKEFFNAGDEREIDVNTIGKRDRAAEFFATLSTLSSEETEGSAPVEETPERGPTSKLRPPPPIEGALPGAGTAKPASGSAPTLRSMLPRRKLPRGKARSSTSGRLPSSGRLRQATGPTGGAAPVETAKSGASGRLRRADPEGSGSDRSHAILGDWALVRKLAGGVGNVYLGQRITSEDRAILHVFRKQDHSKAGLDSLFAEIDLLVRVDSPHLVRILGSHEDKLLRWFVAEYVEGWSTRRLLEKIVTRKGTGLAQLSALVIVESATRGLMKIHETGGVFGHVRPLNLMVPSKAAEEREKLSGEHDLSGAHRLPAEIWDCRLVHPGATLPSLPDPDGSPTPDHSGFAPPEQFTRGQRLIRASDVFSMGALLYYLLTGRAPFSGTSSQIVTRTQNGSYPPLFTVRSDVNPRITRLIARCLRIDPANRYGQARFLLEDLRVVRKSLKI